MYTIKVGKLPQSRGKKVELSERGLEDTRGRGWPSRAMEPKTGVSQATAYFPYVSFVKDKAGHWFKG